MACVRQNLPYAGLQAKIVGCAAGRRSSIPTFVRSNDAPLAAHAGDVL